MHITENQFIAKNLKRCLLDRSLTVEFQLELLILITYLSVSRNLLKIYLLFTRECIVFKNLTYVLKDIISIFIREKGPETNICGKYK